VSDRLKRGESIRHGLRRVSRQELRAARKALSARHRPTDRAIHAARRSLKKVRAVLALVEADVHGRPLGKSRKCLRTINRALSPLRDADAMMASLDHLLEADPQLFHPLARAAVRRRLVARKRALMRHARTDGTWKTVLDGLEELTAASDKWRLRHRGFSAITSTLARTHRRARRRMTVAEATNHAVDFHALRKELKMLWNQLRLLDRGGRVLHADVVALHQAEAALGDDHNIAVLVRELREQVEEGSAAIDRQRLRRVATRCQHALRQRALRRVRRIFEFSAAGYVERIRRAWKDQRHARR
jgi:hypothetical protein